MIRGGTRATPLEEAQALGFSSVQDCDAHQDWLRERRIDQEEAERAVRFARIHAAVTGSPLVVVFTTTRRT